MLTGLSGMGRDNFILKAIFGPPSTERQFAATQAQLSLQKLEV
jgi:hypothetical protein